MADEADQDSKTLEPTEKRLRDAEAKGNTPHARDVISFGSLAALLCFLALFAIPGGLAIFTTLRSVLIVAGELHIDNADALRALTWNMILLLAGPLIVSLAILAGGGILASLLQYQPAMITERITPRWTRLSPAKGIQRIFGPQGLVEFGKTLVKIGVVFAVTIFLLKTQTTMIRDALREEPEMLPGMAHGLVTYIVTILCTVAAALAIGDLAWSRMRWRRSLRMSRHEMKEEMRQAEADPHIKSKRRASARQVSSRRMIEKVSAATMVVVNPTHFAVALQYERGAAGAPVVVAKGVDHLALRIRERAEEQRIPLIENRMLARALYESVEIDTQIPPEFYRAVAEIIHFLNMRNRPVVPAAPR